VQLMLGLALVFQTALQWQQAYLFRAMMCFLKPRVFVFELFPRDNVFFVADVRSWKPVMPRSISGLVMQLMRMANVGGGGFRAEVTSEFEIV